MLRYFKYLINYRCLEAAGVSFLPNIAVLQVHENRLTLVNRNEKEISKQFDVAADLVVLASGVAPSSLISNLNCTKYEQNGKILIDSTLLVKGMTNVYSAGDCAQIDGVLIPSTAQVAMQQSETVAKNIMHQINKVPVTQLEKFSYLPLGEMVSLGFKEASISSLGGLVELDGPLAALGRRLIYAARMPTSTQTITAILSAGLSTAGNIASKIQKR